MAQPKGYGITTTLEFILWCLSNLLGFICGILDGLVSILVLVDVSLELY